MSRDASRNMPGNTRREPISDTQLLLSISIFVFIGMYALAIIIWGGGFSRPQQLFDMLNNNAYLIILSCGLTIVMIAGGIDISVGGVTALVVMACVVGLETQGQSVGESMLMAVGIGLAFGVVQGYLVSYLNIQPFIVTLAGMFFARGLTTIVSVEPRTVKNAAFLALKDARIEIPWLGYTAKNGSLIPGRIEGGVIVALILVALVYIMLKRTRLGRNLYAVGGNAQSALMLGVNVRRTRFMSYIICGLLAGIGGFVFLTHTAAGNATNAAGAEMNAIASSIIGGTLLSGGVGNVIGSLFGTLILSTIKSIVQASGLRDPWWQSITTGAMLCIFILLQSIVLSNRSKGRLSRKLTRGALGQ